MNFDEFKAKVDAEATTPEGAIKLLLIAALETVREKNPEGKKMWSQLLPKDEEPNRRAVEYFGRVVRGTSQPGGIAASYLGGTPANKYTPDHNAALVVTRQVDLGPGNGLKIFVQSGGKDNPSPVQVRQNKFGYWKIFEYSSLYTDVRTAEDKDDF